MHLPDIPLLDVLRTRMSWLNTRQEVLSQNVANADTPGYAAQDLKPIDFESVLKSSTQQSGFQGGLTVTDPHHISISQGGADDTGDTSSEGGETVPTGNSVSIEEEMMKVADTQVQYQAATNLYSKAIGMMRTALDKGGS